MTDRYSKMSPFLRAVDRATAPPDDGSAPVDHVITAGIPGGYNTLHSAVSGLRGMGKGAYDDYNAMGGLRGMVKSVLGELGYGSGPVDHTGKGVPGKVPHYDPETGKTTLIADTPLPGPYDPQGGRNIVLPKMVSPEFGGTRGEDDTDLNVTDVPKNVLSAASVGVRGASGGRMGYAFGGGPNPSSFVERAASYGLRHEGFLNSGVAGRTDHIGLQVHNGSYVIPADVVSAAGQGNSLAGASAFDKLLKQGPYGTSGVGSIKASRPMMPSMRMGNTMRMSNNMGRSNTSGFGSQKSTGIPGFMANGGAAKKPRELVAPKDGNWNGMSAGGVSRPGAGQGIPILAAGGEYIVSPETVARIGNGDPQKGFRILDKLVLLTRKKHIDTLRKLKPPKQK